MEVIHIKVVILIMVGITLLVIGVQTFRQWRRDVAYAKRLEEAAAQAMAEHEAYLAKLESDPEFAQAEKERRGREHQALLDDGWTERWPGAYSKPIPPLKGDVDD